MAEYQVSQIYVRILLLLMEQDTNVSVPAEQLGMIRSALSHQLNLLKSNKLVKRRRDGKMIFYALADGHAEMVIEKACLPGIPGLFSSC